MQHPAVRELEEVYRRGEFGRVIYLADRLLQGEERHRARGSILYWKAKALERSGRSWHGAALSCYREGMAAAGRDRALKARIIASLSTIYSLSGDVPALEGLVRDMAVIAPAGDRKRGHIRPFVWFNYGVALDNCFRWDEAAEAFTLAAQEARRWKEARVLGPSLHNLSGVRLAQGRVAEAAAIMAEAACHMPDKLFRHKNLSRQAEYFVAAGDLVSAQRAITEALVDPHTDDMTRADLYYTWARTLLAFDRPGESREKALQALEFAVQAVHYPGIHKVTRLLQELPA